MFAWEDYPRYRISPTHPSELRHRDVVGVIASLQAASPQSLHIKGLGESVEGRQISLLTIGSGPQTVLAWSQMHGNEPTHTAALLDLVNFLVQDPQHPTASAILSGCRFNVILMLNPDGAERWTRRNAQDIDINRDALHGQSPEGQLLRTVVSNLQPDFALNLHNHRPHTTVGASLQPASFSLLVPPIDAADTGAETVLLAKRLAGYLAATVAPYCPGPVSRYNADFMPRCFGEWVQQKGVATITLEAGGWSTIEAEPLVQLHFFGLVACLEAIVSGSFLEVMPDVYETLPRTGEHDLFDKLLRDVTVLNGNRQKPFRTDLGINFCQAVPTTQGGVIADLGDLHVTSGKRLIPAANLACLPGRIAWLPAVTPSELPNQNSVAALLAAGVTTAVGQVDLAADDDLAELVALRLNFSSPINLGFLAKFTDWSPELLDRLLKAISQGIIGVLADGLPAEVELYLSWFNFPILPADALSTFIDSPATLGECAARSKQSAQRLGMVDRGTICLGAAADLLLFQSDSQLNAMSLLSGSDLQRVIVGGNVVFENGQAVHAPAGKLLSSRLAGL